MMRSPLLHPLHSKKRLIISVATLLVLLCYVVWSGWTWAQLTPRYTQWHQGVTAAIDDTMALPTGTNSEKDAVVVSLKGVSNKIAINRHSICSVTPLIVWQQAIIPAYKESYSACRQKIAAMDDLQKQLISAISYNNDDKTLAQAIASTAPPADSLAETGWAQQVSAWADAVSVTEKAPVSDNFKPIQHLAIAQMSDVKAAWQELIIAHEAKDKQKFIAAQDTLATAIDGLDEIATLSQRTFSKLTAEVEQSAQKALAD